VYTSVKGFWEHDASHDLIRPQYDATVMGVAATPATPPVRKVAEGEAGGACESAGGGRVGVGRLSGDEDDGGPAAEEAEKQRRVEGAVPAEEGGVGDEATKCFARGGGARKVGRGVDPDEDLLHEVAGEVRRSPGFGYAEVRLHRRRTGRRRRQGNATGREWKLGRRVIGFGGAGEPIRADVFDRSRTVLPPNTAHQPAC
jgi:hypothetical protein